MGTEGGSSEHKVGGGGGENGVMVHVRCSNGSKFDVRTALDSKIGSFKSIVAQKCDVPADQQRLIYKGRILKDDQTLESYGLQADHTIHMVRGFTPNVSTTPAATANAGSPNAPLGVTRGVGSIPGGGFGGAGVGVPSLFGAGLPDFDQQNPNMMSDIMNTPAIQSLMNNPDIMRGLIMSNPQMRDIIDRNPELAHILNDPAILRQTLEASRNPELMREMMRNTDRAMSNIESSPEGFNMLRRMYENVQEPFLNATTMGGNAGNDVGSNPFAALSENQAGSNNLSTNSGSTTGPAAPNTNPLPNPWNSTSGGTQTNTTTRSIPVGEARAPGAGGLGGHVLPDMQNMPDTAQLNQMMQNPAVSQMMQSLLSDPQYMNQILNLNPQLRSMVDMNPQLREMMQNPELLRQLTSPETMQQMLTLQQSLNRPQATRTPAQGGGDMDLLMNMFAGLEAGGMSGPNTPNVPPEELYATQLSQLQEMGFFDTQENIRALRASSGNVHAAVERLLGNPGA